MDADKIVAIILALFLPPLAVYMKEGGLTTPFWLDVLLCILVWFPGMLYALYIVSKD